ncbi:MAG: hypothetical protein Kow0090_08840 [Myxococcota bacterium]
MRIYKDIIQSSTPIDKAVESDRPFDANLIQGLIALLEGLKKSCDNLKRDPANNRGERRVGHNHGYGIDEFKQGFALDKNFATENQLLGMHLRKRAVTIDQIERDSIVKPLAVIPARDMNIASATSGGQGAYLLGNAGMLFEFLVSPGTISVDVELGVKSSGLAFDVLFKPDFYRGFNYFAADDAGWATVAASGDVALTWLSVAKSASPSIINKLRMGVAAKNNNGNADLNIWAIRVTENDNQGIWTTGEVAGFFADIHQADLHTIEGYNIPDLRTP